MAKEQHIGVMSIIKKRLVRLAGRPVCWLLDQEIVKRAIVIDGDAGLSEKFSSICYNRLFNMVYRAALESSLSFEAINKCLCEVLVVRRGVPAPIDVVFMDSREYAEYKEYLLHKSDNPVT